MEHIGIDLGGRESQVCIRNDAGDVILETRLPTVQVGFLLKGRPRSRVVLETSAESFSIADSALQWGHTVNVVPGSLVRSLGIGSRGVKTDIRDARLQSELSCRMKDLPRVHVPSHASRELKSALNLRDVLVSSRTQLCNSVRGYLRRHLLRVRCTPNTMPQRVRTLMLSRPEGLPTSLERHLVVLEVLNAQIKQADAELQDSAHRHPICRLLMTAPGVGPVTASRFVSSIDEVSRFANAHALQSYLGLTPGESSSSERVRRTGITKAGPSPIRKCLAQACWTIYRTQPDEPLAQWGQRIAERRNRPVAICAMMRKLAGILYAMWRDNRIYDSSLSAATM